MKDYTKRLEGAVTIEGSPQLSYKGLWVDINEHGIHIPRLIGQSQVDNCGAHFRIYCLTSIFLLNFMTGVRCKRWHYQFLGPYLGGMSEFSGYPSSDLGTNEYPIISLNMSVEFFPDQCKFEFSGILGNLLPWTDHYNRGDKVKLSSFNIEFNIPDSEIGNVISDAETFLNYRNKYIFSS